VAEGLGWRFAKLWTASTTPALGSGLATIAPPLFVAAHTKSPLIVSATSAAAGVPWLLFALPGGVLVDRVDAAHTSSGSCCSRSACTPRCGPSWETRCGSG
jgi:hypothetical protein